MNREQGYYWVKLINKPFQLDEWVIANWFIGKWFWAEKEFSDADMFEINETKIVRNAETEVFVVLCKYDGCEECSSGSHIVGIFATEEAAFAAEKKHDSEKEAHLHSWICETIKLPITK